MKQECSLLNVWFTWLGIPLLAAAMWIYLSWWAGIVVLFAGAFAQYYYVRKFPSLSKLLGYGTVEDVKGSDKPDGRKRVLQVVLYTANVCPFCPLVRKRLVELQHALGFDLKEIDVTFRPDLVRRKGLRAVPVVEVEDRRWVGNATSLQLEEFLTEAR